VQVVVHPIVLLHTVDHYFRIAKDTKKRVVGILLGEVYKGRVDITNCYAVPFEEDPKDTDVVFFDHIYHEEMFAMFKKVNAKEKVVGWYSTGPKIKPADLELNEVIRNYTPNPVLVIINANPTDDLGIPTEAYVSVESIDQANPTSQRTFVHVPSSIGALEAEEIGVEHLLRDIRDTTVTTLTKQVSAKLSALRQLKGKIEQMKEYLDQCVAGTVQPNAAVLYKMQDVFNLVPNLKAEELVKAFAVTANDQTLVVYMAALVRSVVALHSLIVNKIACRDHEQKRVSGALEEKADKADKEGKDTKEKKESIEGKDAKSDKAKTKK
jgi:26S proteasome regulatory subunit N8